MTHIIRLAKLNDTSAIATVLVESWRTTYPGIVAQNYIDQLSVEAQAKRWEHRLSGEAETAAATLVAQEATGSIIGFASGGPIRKPLAGFDAELYAIYIVRTGQGRGLGRQLLKEWAHRALALGLRAAIVRVLTANPASAFYEHLGARHVKHGMLELDGKSYPETWYGWDDLTALTA